MWASQTGDAGTWIDITGNLELLGGACNKYVQPREFTEFNGEICLTVSKLNGRLYNFFYYDIALMCKSIDGLTDVTVPWVSRISPTGLGGVSSDASGNRDLFYLEKFPGFMGHDQALFAGVNNYGHDGLIETGGYQVWYTFGDYEAGTTHYQWHQLVANGYGDAAAQMGMTLKYWNNHMFVGSATWMGMILEPTQGKITNVGKGCELIRIDTNGNVQLIVGDLTPKIAATAVPNTRSAPLSGLQAGFGWPFNAYVWQMEEYKGWLYIGTYDASSKFLTYGQNLVHFLEANPEIALLMLESTDPEFYNSTAVQALVNAVNWDDPIPPPYDSLWAAFHATVDAVIKQVIFNGFAGFDLWKSQDGVHWFPVLVNGLGSGAQVGIRRLVNANNKLYIGTASFYGEGFRIYDASA